MSGEKCRRKPGNGARLCTHRIRLKIVTRIYFVGCHGGFERNKRVDIVVCPWDNGIRTRYLPASTTPAAVKTVLSHKFFGRKTPLLKNSQIVQAVLVRRFREVFMYKTHAACFASLNKKKDPFSETTDRLYFTRDTRSTQVLIKKCVLSMNCKENMVNCKFKTKVPE